MSLAGLECVTSSLGHVLKGPLGSVRDGSRTLAANSELAWSCQNGGSRLARRMIHKEFDAFYIPTSPDVRERGVAAIVLSPWVDSQSPWISIEVQIHEELDRDVRALVCGDDR